MAQVTAYVPDDIEKQMKLKAKSQGQSVSAYLTDLVKQDIGLAPGTFSPEFLSLFGCMADDPLEIPDDPPPQPVKDPFQSDDP